MITRSEAVQEALASVRLEGLEPGDAEAVLKHWAAGELTDEQLEQATQHFIAGEPANHLLGIPAAPVPAA